MRLIDANTLKAEYTGNFRENYHYTAVRALIDVAPTIDTAPVVHGRWIEKEDGCYYDCSACGESWITIEGTPAENLMMYCPKCGAKMDLEEEA